MAGVLQHLRSSTLNKRPNPASMVDGQVAINYASGAPGMFFKDSNGALVKVGPVHVGSGAPNAVPASGGTAGNSIGEQWLDTSGGTYVFKIWDGSAWRSEAGEFVNVTGDTMTGALGIIAGSATSPSLFISGDANTGLFSPGADQLSVTTGGTERLRVDSAGQIEAVSLGSASAPTYSFTTDPNTGIYSPGADQVAISTNGTGRLFVDASGNVGVNTTPYAVSGKNIEVADGNVARLMATNTSVNGRRYAWYSGTAGQFSLYDYTGSSERLTIDSSGRLGLGTSSPLAGTGLDARNGSIAVTGYTFWSRNSSADGVSTRGLLFTIDGTDYGRVYSPNGKSVAIQAGSGTLTDAVTVDQSGRVGIGDTGPSAKLSVVGSAGSTLAAFTTPGVATVYIGISGQSENYYDANTQIFRAGNSSTERMRIDSSGRFLVGTSSSPSAGDGQYARIVAQGYTGGATGGGYISLQRGEAATAITAEEELGLINFGDSAGNTFGTIACRADATAGSGDYPGRLSFSTTSDNSASPVERLRISSKGVVSIGQSSPTGSNTNYLQVYNGDSSQNLAFVSSDGAGNEWHFGRKTVDGNFYVIRQTGTGMYMSTNSWVATSDQRAKQNIADIESTIDVVKALKPSRFNWKSDGTADVGFIAQQVQALIPEAVVDSGNPDAMLGITQDKLLPFVVKALQEAVAKIETLEAKVKTLESK